MKTKLKILLAAIIVLCCIAGTIACGTTDNSGSDSPDSSSGSSSVVEKTVTLNETLLELDRFGEGELIATSDSEGDKFEWISSDPEVVSVDENGRLVAMGEGECTITVKIKGSNATANCDVKVKRADKEPVLTLNVSENYSMLKGGSAIIIPAFKYDDKDAGGVVYSYKSSKPDILAVNDEGVMNALAIGEAKVLVSATWRGCTIKKNFAVKVNPNASLRILNGENEVVEPITLRTSLPEGADPSYISEVELKAMVTANGEPVTDPPIDWSVEGEAVSCENGKIIARKAGAASVTAGYDLNGDYVAATVEFTVVLPDMDSDVVLAIDRVYPDDEMDFSGFAGEVISVRANGIEILNEDRKTVNGEWLNAQPNGEAEVDVCTTEIIYHARLKVSVKYIQPNLADTADVNILEQLPDEASPRGVGLGGLWDTAKEEDREIIGDDIDGVFKFSLDADRPKFGFNNRMEVNGRFLKAEHDYFVFEAWIPEGEKIFGFCGKVDGADRYFDIKPNITGGFGYIINADGVKSNTAHYNEWITIVLNASQIHSTRFMLYSGQKCMYYVRNLRFYMNEGCDIPYLTEANENKKLFINETLEMEPSMFKTACVNGSALTPEIVSAVSSDPAVIEVVDNKTIKALAKGNAKIAVTLKSGKNILKTDLPVSVMEKSSITIQQNGEPVPETINMHTLTDDGRSAYSVQFTALGFNNGAEVEDKDIEWTASNPEMVSCEGGHVVVKDFGTTTVTAKFTAGDGEEYSASVELNIAKSEITDYAYLEIDRAEEEHNLSVMGVIESITVGETDILKDGKIDKEWLEAQANGFLDNVRIETSLAAYTTKFFIYDEYVQPDLSDLSQITIKEQIPGESAQSGVALGGLWDRAKEEDREIIGDDIDGVFKFNLTSNRSSVNFSNRIEFNLKAIGGTQDFVVYKAFIPNGKAIGGFGGRWNGNGAEIWLDVKPGVTMLAERGFVINADGLTGPTKADEWITVVIKLGDFKSNRFCFMAPGGRETCYYIKDMRFYSRAKCDIPYLTESATMELDEGAIKTVEPSMLNVATVSGVGNAEILSVKSLNETLLKADGMKLQALQTGDAQAEVTLKVGKNELKVILNITINPPSVQD